MNIKRGLDVCATLCVTASFVSMIAHDTDWAVRFIGWSLLLHFIAMEADRG